MQDLLTPTQGFNHASFLGCSEAELFCEHFERLNVYTPKLRQLIPPLITSPLTWSTITRDWKSWEDKVTCGGIQEVKHGSDSMSWSSNGSPPFPAQASPARDGSWRCPHTSFSALPRVPDSPVRRPSEISHRSMGTEPASGNPGYKHSILESATLSSSSEGYEHSIRLCGTISIGRQISELNVALNCLPLRSIIHQIILHFSWK
jgi:hypothetical protein